MQENYKNYGGENLEGSLAIGTVVFVVETCEEVKPTVCGILCGIEGGRFSIQYNTIQTIQYNTVQCSAVQCQRRLDSYSQSIMDNELLITRAFSLTR